jgi:hypothetical protein
VSYALLRTALKQDPQSRAWLPVATELLPDAADVALDGKRVRLEEVQLPEAMQ